MNKNFLSKKSWHPQTLRNVEKVWIKEREHDQEQKKIELLKREVAEHEQIRELKEIHQQATGQAKREKVDWLYEPPAAQPSSDEFLLGRPVKEEVQKRISERPGSLFSQERDPVLDALSKVKMDPLLAIKQQEHSSLKRILENPVQMRGLEQEKLAELLAKRVSYRAQNNQKKVSKCTKRIIKLLSLAAKDKFAFSKLRLMLENEPDLAQVAKALAEKYSSTAHGSTTPAGTTSTAPTPVEEPQAEGKHHKHHKHHHHDKSDKEDEEEISRKRKAEEPAGETKPTVESKYGLKEVGHGAARRQIPIDQLEAKKEEVAPPPTKRVRLSDKEREEALEKMKEDARKHMDSRLVKAEKRMEEHEKEAAERRKQDALLVKPQFLKSMDQQIYGTGGKDGITSMEARLRANVHHIQRRGLDESGIFAK